MSRHTRGRRSASRTLRLDLHMHSDRSDGRLPPQQVLERCALGGLDIIALTDHDLPPVLTAGTQQVAGRSIRVIHGVELSTMHEDTEQHLLVYFRDEIPAEFAAFCRQLVIARADRYDAAREAIGLPGIPPADEAARRGERSLTRTHIARAIVEAGHATTMNAAFDRWVGESAGLVPPVPVSFIGALQRAKEAGGVTSWAHPSLRRAESWVRDFAEAGLDALEVFRPSHGRTKREALLKLAWRHGLHMTGGSDYHGWTPGELGAFSMSGRAARPLAHRLGLPR
ncbi:MAG: putative metal-dependent phosphoesterase TrpH [Myxococcota bacterium]|jgi:predicted metal-dependent phosphoesterase TrpH